jgi:hypothetical protein
MKDDIQNLEENILYIDHTKENKSNININSNILQINNKNFIGENSSIKEEYLFNIEALIKGKYINKKKEKYKKYKKNIKNIILIFI